MCGCILVLLLPNGDGRRGDNLKASKQQRVDFAPASQTRLIYLKFFPTRGSRRLGALLNLAMHALLHSYRASRAVPVAQKDALTRAPDPDTSAPPPDELLDLKRSQTRERSHLEDHMLNRNRIGPEQEFDMFIELALETVAQPPDVRGIQSPVT